MANKKTSKPDELTIAQKKEYAELLYVQQGITVGKELADRVGVSAVTISKWVNENDKAWERKRQSTLITKDSELRRFYMQLTELNDLIMERPKGERFANSKEADTLSKLTKSIRDMETELNLAEITESLMGFIAFVRNQDYELAKQVTKWADHFIKSKM